jgi:(S)-citramalyl-CoA lyase
MTDEPRSQILRRSVLFFPALAVERYDEAMRSGADMIVFDLEDGTVTNRKQEARDVCLPLFAKEAGPTPIRLLRINNPRGPEGMRDLLALLDLEVPPDGLILPKVETVDDIHWVADILADRHANLELVVLIETPRGLRNATEIARATQGRAGPQVTCLFLGTADYSAEIGSDLSWDALAYARGVIVNAAKEAGIDAMDGVFFDPTDEQGLREEAKRIAAMGFTGKASYDAIQIPIIHDILAPTADRVDWARRVMDVAANDALGTARLDGRMVNESIVRTARRILALNDQTTCSDTPQGE